MAGHCVSAIVKMSKERNYLSPIIHSGGYVISPLLSKNRLRLRKGPPQILSMPLFYYVLLFLVVGLCEGVEYFLDEDEHYVQSGLGSVKLSKIPPEIRVLAKYGEFHKTIYDLPNTETVLKGTHFQLDPYDFAHWNDTHHSNGWERSHSGKIDPEQYHPADSTDIYLECTSFYPVEWVYEGDGVSWQF